MKHTGRTLCIFRQRLQAPFASDMLAAPTGAAVAWVFNAKGCSNIWVADPSHGAKARQITRYTEDDGFDIGELAWSPDAKSIAFTRGQSLEDNTPANVNTSPEGTMPREVWVVATAGGAPRKVGAGDSPTFSPDGSRLLFVDKKRILTVAASGNDDAQPLLIAEPGRVITMPTHEEHILRILGEATRATIPL